MDDEHVCNGSVKTKSALHTSAPLNPAAAPTPPPDGGYGWVIVVCSCVLNFMTSAMVTLFGFLLVELMHHFEVKASVLTWIGSVTFAFGPLFGVFIGAIIKHYGCRIVSIIGTLMISSGYFISAFMSNIPALYLTMGMLPGLGFGCVLGTASVAVQQYFTKRRALASGISMAGLSVGFIICAPLIRLLITTYGWRGTLMVMAGVMLHGCICGALLRPLNNSAPVRTPQEECNKDVSYIRKCLTFMDFSILKDAPFSIFLMAVVFVLSGHLVPYMYTPIRCEHLGVDQGKVPMLISLMGLCSAVSRIAFGMMSDLKWFRTRRGAVFAVMTACAGLSLIVSVNLKYYEHLVAFSAGFGILSGSYFGILMTVSADLLNPENMAQGIGFIVATFGGSHLLAHPIIGIILDATSSPTLVFIVFGCVEIFGGTLAFVSYLLHKKKLKKSGTAVPEVEVKIVGGDVQRTSTA